MPECHGKLRAKHERWWRRMAVQSKPAFKISGLYVRDSERAGDQGVVMTECACIIQSRNTASPLMNIGLFCITPGPAFSPACVEKRGRGIKSACTATCKPWNISHWC
jgi:hypothetical protein